MSEGRGTSDERRGTMREHCHASALLDPPQRPLHLSPLAPDPSPLILPPLIERFFKDLDPPVRNRLLPSRSICLLLAVLLAGAGLRLLWPADIEYKTDEAWTFERTQAPSYEPLWFLGMPTSAGIRNPGMSIWAFQLLAWLFRVKEPPQLARCVQCLAIAANIALVAFAHVCVSGKEREPWLWAAAFHSVNPIAIVFERKIWPPSLLPILMVAFLTCWWFRRRCPAAFLWGLLGAVMGQIHLAASFFAGGFAAWTLCFDRRGVAWKSWLLGCAIGCVPSLTWLRYVVAEVASNHVGRHVVKHAFEFKFWIRWMTEPLGIGLHHSLGSHFLDFLRYPLVHGQSTFMVAVLHVTLAAIGFYLWARGAFSTLVIHRQWEEVLCGRKSPSVFAVNAAVWGYGLCLTLSLLPIHRHYMIIVYPLEMLWLARLSLQSQWLWSSRRLLGVLCVGQFLLSISFLGYIHVNHGAINADYGLAYSAVHRGQ
jgi:hypothetical protein